MSAKLPYSLTDENPDLQKQIGCMNGILQLFDRHRFLAGRRISSRTHKRLPPGTSILCSVQFKLPQLFQSMRSKLVMEETNSSYLLNFSESKHCMTVQLIFLVGEVKIDIIVNNSVVGFWFLHFPTLVHINDHLLQRGY